MKFTKLEIEGAYLIEVETFEDERGSFSRQFCQNEFIEKSRYRFSNKTM